MDKLIEGFYVIPNPEYPDRDSLWDGMIHDRRADAEGSLDAARPEWGQDAENYHAVALVPAELADVLQQLEMLGLSLVEAVERLQQAWMLAAAAVPADAVSKLCDAGVTKEVSQPEIYIVQDESGDVLDVFRDADEATAAYPGEHLSVVEETIWEPGEYAALKAQHPDSSCCSTCRELIDAADLEAGHGMCGSCLHNAKRSGWTPEATS